MDYEVVIGLETHVQLHTKTKMFCACGNRFGAEPNTLVCPVCMGYPGTLPVPNHEAIMMTVKAGLLTDCEISRFSKFDRKSYFYPDMPKNYQISQYDLPFCLAGRVHIHGMGFSGNPLPDKHIRLTRIHLEEDVAKLTHFAKSSGVDYNRAGVPLMEVVSEPDMHSADEAYAYLVALKEIMQFGAISDCDQEKGQMRCDVNISLRPRGQKELGVKAEIKNLNSISAVYHSINYEIWRQKDILESGGQIRQETLGWHADRGETYLMRTKEQAHDYRYFPDPDLMPIIFSEADIAQIKAELPELPDAMRSRLVSIYGLAEYDAEILTQDKALSGYFEAAAKVAQNPKLVANWVISELLRVLGENSIEITNCPIAPAMLAQLTDLIENKTISGKIAKDVFAEMYNSGKTPEAIVKDKGLVQVTDAGEIESFVDAAIAANPGQVEQYKSGNAKVLQFFVGQVMKLSKGKANPQMVVGLLEQKLNQ